VPYFSKNLFRLPTNFYACEKWGKGERGRKPVKISERNKIDDKGTKQKWFK